MSKESIYKRYVIGAEPESKLDEKSYFLVFYGDKVLLDGSSERAQLPYVMDLEVLKVQPIRIIYLGTFEKSPCYVAEIEEVLNLPDQMQFYDLRSLYDETDHDLFLLAGKAMQLINWDKTHQFCGRCGTRTNTMKKEMAKICPECGLVSYTRISPAIIVGISKGSQILLAHAGNFKGKMYSVLAGFAEAGENLEETVKREVMEEVGITIKNIKYFGSQSWPFSSSMMIGFTAEYESGEIKVDGKEIVDAGWFAPQNLPELPSEYSIAREIIDHHIKRNTL
ncbi:MAG: diphosphatase [Clostridia bacterium]|nr:diphosphatase [Clostridia bacterium]